MKRTLTATTLAMTMTSTMIGTQAKAEGVIVKYNYSCADWSNANTNEPSLSEAYRRGVARGWLVGMINGLALASDNDFWFTGSGLEPEQVFYWMDQYCNSDPLGGVVQGIYTLMDERLGRGWY